MYGLLEDPWPIIYVGAVVQAVLLIFLLVTRRAVVLLWMAVVLLVTLCGVCLEWIVVTDVESVENTVYEAAEALKSNDVDRVLSLVSPSAVQTRQRVKLAMRHVKVLETKVNDLTVKVDYSVEPKTAKANFVGIVALEERTKDVLPYGRYIARFTVDFRREGSLWLVTGHAESKPF